MAKATMTGVNGHKPTYVVVAEGTDHERKLELKLLRGKRYKQLHLKLLETFAELEGISRSLEGSQLKGIIEAISRLFANESIDFEGEMLPFALGLDSAEDRQWIEELLPLEQFMAYMEAAAFIVNGGKSEAVQAALKK